MKLGDDPWTQMRVSFAISMIYVLIVMFFVVRIVSSSGEVKNGHKQGLRAGSEVNKTANRD